jgi:hypothetical protein
MYKFGRKPAIRTYGADEDPCTRRRSLWHSALRLMRSMPAPNSYQEAHRIFRRTPRLFALDEVEAEFLSDLLNRSYGVSPGFFSKGLIDRIQAKADAIFRNTGGGKIDLPAPPGGHISADRKAHGAFSGFERAIQLPDPLASIPEALDIVFHESILKIAAHFFRQIPRGYKISIMRYCPNRLPMCLSRIHQGTDGRISLLFIVDLVDIEESHGPLVYIPEAHQIHTRPSVPPEEVQDGHVGGEHGNSRKTERGKWVVLRGKRGSITAIAHRSSHASLWTYPADTSNNPRTSIIIIISGYKPGEIALQPQNRMLRWNFDRMTELQQMFAYPRFIDEPIPEFAKVG